jgi:hypothetical protein
MSYDRLMQVVAEQAMQRAMVQINRRTSQVARASSVPACEIGWVRSS